MRRYESYKDSGVEWLGEIPSHWEMQRSKFLFKKIERKVKEIDQIVTCFRDGQVTLRANRRTDGFTNALKEHGYQGIRKGDLVIHAMDAFAGAIGVSDSDGKATPVYSVCLPYNKQKVNVYFYAYYLRNLALSGFITSLAKGIRERSTDFRYADFAELLLPLPTYSEQQKIAQFLDDKTAKIDQAVDLAEKQIALLKEHKQILIQNAVTRGLNPDVPLKDSGVEWIGQVPEHWEKYPLFVQAKISSITNHIDKELLSVYLDRGVIRFSDVDEKRTNVTSLDLSKYQLVRKGNFVLNNQQAWRGSVGISNYEGIVSPAYLILELSNKFESNYANYLFRNGTMVAHYFVASKGVGSIQRNLYWGNLRRTPIFIPPLSEQQRIADYLDAHIAKIDQAIALKTAHIEKLKEYKNVLINDVVTGKVRVSV